MELQNLKKELPYKWRVQSANQYGATCVAYIDARFVQDLLDEDAREFSQEGQGHRWYVLKRFGAETMAKQINTYGGSDNYLMKIVYVPATGKTNITTNVTNAISYQSVRTNFNVATNRRWPIPQSQINAMGGTFPQNIGYN